MDEPTRTPSPKDEKVVSTPSLPTLTIPDGGLQAWMSVLGGFLVQFATFGYTSSFGVYQDYYVLKGGYPSSNVSWIGSLQFFLMFAMGFPAGRWFDDGYFRLMSITGTLLYSFSLFMLSLAHPQNYYQLILAQGVGMGLGSGLLLVPAISLQSHYWKRHRALAMGIVLTGSSCGGIVYPIMLNQLFQHSTGFAWGVRASAFLTFGILVIAACVMKTRLPSANERPGFKRPSIISILDRAYSVTLFGTFLVIWGLFFPYFYLQLWVNYHHLSSTLGFYTIAILNAASIAGRVIPNSLADRTGQFNVICPVACVCAALIFAMFGATSAGAVIVFAILYGFFSGACTYVRRP